MSADDKRVQDYLGRIRARVSSWSQGDEYGLCGWPQDAPVRDVIFLLHHIVDLEEEIYNLEVEASEKNAWEGRYNALLEECEASRPRTVEGDGGDLPVGTVVLDVDEAAWQRTCSGIWELVGGAYDLRETLSLRWAPYVIIYTPTPKENTNE